MIRFKLKQLIADREFQTGERLLMIDIAAASGVDRMTLSRMVNHRGTSVRTDALNRLCGYFQCPLEALAEYVPDDQISGLGTKEPGGQNPRGKARKKR